MALTLTPNQAAAGVLSLEDVHRLMAYVVDQIGGWQVPARARTRTRTLTIPLPVIQTLAQP